MTPHDTLRDRLLDAAGSAAPGLPGAAELRRSAVRHRRRRRAAAGSAAVLSLAAVAVAGSTVLSPRTTSLGPAVPMPSTSAETVRTSEPDPAPSTSAPATDPSATDAPTGTGEPALSEPEARTFVETFRFDGEEQWSQDLDFPSQVDTTQQVLDAHFCEAARADGLLATRQVLYPGPDSASRRQVALFPDASTAAQAFAALRSHMRPCHATTTLEIEGRTVERSVVGGQLDLADESFWVASKDVVLASDDPASVGTELFYSTASLFVLDGNVVVHVEDPAFGDDLRAQFVQDASAEWERLREAYEPVRR